MARERITPADLDTLLAKLIGETRTAEQWSTLIKAADGIGKYSTRNRALVIAQRPDARSMHGFRAWQKYGRQVTTGERGVKILAPNTRSGASTKDKGDGYEAPDLTPPTERTTPTATGAQGTEQGATRRTAGAHTMTVFDIAQTHKTDTCQVCHAPADVACPPPAGASPTSRRTPPSRATGGS